MELSADEHGSCLHCGFNLNGERIYDYFLSKHFGDKAKASEYAEMYGAKEGYGRFGYEIYVKSYDKDYKKLEPYFQCPECSEKCYQKE